MTMMRFALRPFFAVSSPGQGRISPSAMALNRSTTYLSSARPLAKKMREERGRRVAGKRRDRLHGAVSFVPVFGNGGDASPGHPPAARLTARPVLSAAQGMLGGTATKGSRRGRRRTGSGGRMGWAPRRVRGND